MSRRGWIVLFLIVMSSAYCHEAAAGRKVYLTTTKTDGGAGWKTTAGLLRLLNTRKVRDKLEAAHVFDDGPIMLGHKQSRTVIRDHSFGDETHYKTRSIELGGRGLSAKGFDQKKSKASVGWNPFAKRIHEREFHDVVTPDSIITALRNRGVFLGGE